MHEYLSMVQHKHLTALLLKKRTESDLNSDSGISSKYGKILWEPVHNNSKIMWLS